MDVIGNNIANVNTAGYKTARVIFQDIFSQNISAGMANQGEIGGTNPMQVGLGIRLSTVDIIHSRSAFQRTDRETDMMINGDGFFIVGQMNPETGQWETFYTRAGNFDLDNEGYLVTSQGFYVMGRTHELTMGVVNAGNEEIVRRDMIRANQFRGATFDDDLLANPLPIGIFRVGDVIPIGTIMVGDPTPAPNAAAITITEANIDDYNGRPAGPGGVPAAVQPPALVADRAWPPQALSAVPFTPARPPSFGLVSSDDFRGIEPPDANGLTRIRAVANLVNLPEDPVTRMPVGFPPRNDDETDAAYTIRLQDWIDQQELVNGTREVGLPGVGVADNGDISVIIGNRSVVIGRLSMAMFANPAGLEAAGNSLYRQTASSGQVVITEAFADGAGKVEGGGLEMSNVDLANEFTDMIVTQRGFQANSRIISVTDSMLEELVNLKR